MAAPPSSQPLRSMTGYGRGAAEERQVSAEVELRSVNGKGLGIKLRLPSDRLALEPRLDACLRKRLERGSIQGSVRVRLGMQPAGSLDLENLRRYLRQWRAAEKKLGLEARDPGLADLLALPGAVEAPTETAAASRAVARAVAAAFESALDALVAAREKEGARLRKELLRLTGRAAQDLAAIRRRLPEAARAASSRFKERVRQAWESAGVREPLDLTREIAVLAERADVSEEVARLDIHLEHLRELLKHGGPCGREMEFLAQECQREVTTLGNKSSDAGLAESVVALKSEVQRIREQVANVE